MSLGNPPEPPFRARAIDAAAMKAFAHPLRMAIHRYLADYEVATATTLAKELGESTGQTSYHLRQLERHGFVEEVPGRGSGRERWWRSVGFSYEGLDMAEDDEALGPLTLVLQTEIQRRTESLRDWFRRARSEDAEVIAAALNNTATFTMTTQEAGAMKEALMQVMQEHTDAAVERREKEGDVGRRRWRVYLDAIPLPSGPQQASGAAPGGEDEATETP